MDSASALLLSDEEIAALMPGELDDYLHVLEAETAAAEPRPIADSPGALAATLTGGREAQRGHLDLIDDAYLRMDAGEVDRVLVIEPPQTGKTTRAGVRGPLWWLQRHPDHPVLYNAYGLHLAQRAGREVRNLILEHGPSLGLELSKDSRSKADWDLLSGGGMRCRGVGGGTTGWPARLAIIDDPYKDRAAAESPTVRENVYDWWTGVLIPRMHPEGKILVIGHVWTSDDLQFRLLDDEGRVEEGGRWLVIHLPALAVPHITDPETLEGLDRHDPRRRPDPLGRAEGEPLPHPQIPAGDTPRLLAHWHDKRRTTQPKDWDSLFQGFPHSGEGKLISWRQLRDARCPASEVPAARRVAVALDPSGGGSSEAGIIGGLLGQDRRAYATHDRSGTMTSTEWGRAACLLAHEISADLFVVERNYGGDQAGTILRLAWQVLLSEGQVSGICPAVTEVTAKRGKTLRADPYAQAIREDRARLAGLFPELESQWATYVPGDDSPDRLDAHVYLLTELLPEPGSAPAEVLRSQRRVPGVESARRGLR